MSVQEVNVVDFVSLDQVGNVVLTISDHLDWDLEQEHLLLLQNKINRYCDFIKAGELFEKYPEAKDKRVKIRVVGFSKPTASALKFFDAVKESVGRAGYIFEFQEYEEDV